MVGLCRRPPCVACGEGGERTVRRDGPPPGLPGTRRSEMRLRALARQDRREDVPVASDLLVPADPVLLAAGDLGLPAPARLALTAGWSLAESLGLPVVAYAGGERLAGQGAGMPAAAAPLWVAARRRKGLAARGSGRRA